MHIGNVRQRDLSTRSLPATVPPVVRRDLASSLSFPPVMGGGASSGGGAAIEQQLGFSGMDMMNAFGSSNFAGILQREEIAQSSGQMPGSTYGGTPSDSSQPGGASPDRLSAACEDHMYEHGSHIRVQRIRHAPSLCRRTMLRKGRIEHAMA